MNAAVLVDTDSLIDAARDDQRAVAFLAGTRAANRLAVSAITEMELVVGCRNKADLRAVERFLGDHFEVVPLDAAISAQALDLLKKYRLSHGLLIPDALIAATAQVAARVLATKNRSDFRFIEGLRLLDYPTP